MRAPTREEMHEEGMATRSTEERPLYCIAAEEFDAAKKRWELILRYNHAVNAHFAQATYVQARVLEGVIFKVVACAPVVGFKVLDNQGMVLAA